MQRRQSSTFAWPTLSAAAVLAMLFSALGQLAPMQPLIAAPALVLLAGPAERQHCSTCGWIEAKRELVPQLMDPHALKIFEYTLRMADGSVSLFQETQPTSWRVGERVMLIEGGGPPE